MLEYDNERYIGTIPSGGGGTINNQDKTITINGEYTADEGYTGLGTVTVNVAGGGGKYELLQTITDDSNNEIGKVCGFFTDTGGTEYAVVALKKSYYQTDMKYCNDTSNVITGLPEFNTNLGGDHQPFLDKNTATFNTQKIVDFCTNTGAISSSANWCRGKSFVIDGVTYYGQLPNIHELVDIISHSDVIDITDPSRGFYYPIWSSTQMNSGNGWYYDMTGSTVHNTSKGTTNMVIPVLELPN